MTDIEAKYDFAQHLLGMSFGIGLLIEGMQTHCEPSILDEAAQAEIATIFGRLHECGARLAQLGLEFRQS